MSNQPNNKPMGFAESVILMALMMSLVAMSIDAMLPALAQMGTALHVQDTNNNQLIISVLFLGFALGQMVYGPLSDSIGRKPSIYIGFSIAAVGYIVSIYATSLPEMLVGRLLQGFGLASPKIVIIALVRDQHKGASMARVMSFIMTIFILVPTVAPAIGQAILFVANWRSIFTFILIVSLFILVWFAVRQKETLTKAHKTPFSWVKIWRNSKIVLQTPTVLAYTIMSGLVFASLLGYLNSVQQIFQDEYVLGDMFPLYFAAVALAIGCASFTNAKLVMIYGMVHMSTIALFLIACSSLLFFMFAWSFAGKPPLWTFMLYVMLVMFCAGILMGNLNALAMEPLGEHAGLGASLIGTFSTLISLPFGIAIGQLYNGTVLPLVAGFGLLSSVCLWLMIRTNKTI